MRPLSIQAGLASVPRRGTPALVLDADRTLAPDDTGRLVGSILGVKQTIRRIFDEHGYTTKAFASHAAVWSEIDVDRYLHACGAVARCVRLHDTWLQVLTQNPDVTTCVVTSGLPQVWRQVLALHGLHHIPVIGGAHAALDPWFVSPDCKARVIRQLQSEGHQVAAVGDSPIDFPMLATCDLPAFVADEKGSGPLRALLSALPQCQHIITDARRFLPFQSVSTSNLVTQLQNQERPCHAA